MSPSAGRWVASRRGQPVGRIERIDGSYRAWNGRDRSLGVFDDLDSARGVIDRQVERRAGVPGVSVVTALLWGVIGGATTVTLVLVIALFRTGG